MVDRPIKKSEREAAQKANPEAAPVSNVPPPIKKGDRKDGGEAGSEGDRGRSRGKGKGRGKGRGRGKDDGPKAPMNPALVRGPKPTAKVAEPEVPEEEATVEADVDSGADATADTAEATEAAPAAEATPAAEAAEG